ncbi:MAG: hypothetical protein U0T79_09240 [Ferruginibacter sp.]
MIIEDNIGFDPQTGNFITLPAIKLFGADRTIVNDDKPVLISWDVENSHEIFLNGIKVDKKGSSRFICKETTLFCLTAIAGIKNDFSVKKELVIEVDNRPPVIEWFRANEMMIVQGMPLQLSWSIKGAKSVIIDNGVGDVTNVTSKTINIGSSGIFTISASNYFGRAVKEQVEVSVLPVPLINGIFVPEPVFNLKMPVISKPLLAPVTLNLRKAKPINILPTITILNNIHIYGKKLFVKDGDGESFFMPGGRS